MERKPSIFANFGSPDKTGIASFIDKITPFKNEDTSKSFNTPEEKFGVSGVMKKDPSIF
jgi:hypothetical protein